MSTPTPISNPSSKLSLVSLPGEIRNKIYHHVLSLSPPTPRPARLSPQTRKLRTAAGKTVYLSTQARAPVLGQVNRQLRHEVMSLYYSAQVWHLPPPALLCEWDVFGRWISDVVGETFVQFVERLVVSVNVWVGDHIGAERSGRVSLGGRARVCRAWFGVDLREWHKGQRVVIRRSDASGELTEERRVALEREVVELCRWRERGELTARLFLRVFEGFAKCDMSGYRRIRGSGYWTARSTEADLGRRRRGAECLEN